MLAEVQLRDVTEDDLAIFYEQQLDPVANRMAAFTAKDPADRGAFLARWQKILADESVTAQTVLLDDQVAGHIGCHTWFGEPEITYWIGRPYWGKGVATRALALLLEEVTNRPLLARAATDNVASIRVLEKNGFSAVGREVAFANARGQEIEEVIFQLG
jgi:RimJ/RimL family protein N-acetyltransferase